MKTTFLFAWFPYVATVLALAGLAIRSMRLQEQGRAESLPFSTFKDRMWLVSLILMLVAHLLGIVFPHQILVWNSRPVRLYALEAILFAIGLILFAGCLAKVWRQLRDPGETTFARLVDTVFLSLFFVEILSGLTIAVLYRWGSFWAVVTLTPYVRSLLQGSPQVAFITELPFLIALHVFCTFACMATLPLTRVAPLLVGILQKTVTVTLAPATGVVHTGARAAEAWFRKHNPALWLWPEEED
jgi:nitrate reductase gamma subunit